MKICHVITRMILGGAQENTLATVAGLARRGHTVTLISGPEAGAEGRLLDFHPELAHCPPFTLLIEPHLVRPIHPWHDACAYRRLARHFDEQAYDIVHTHSSKAGILGRLAVRGARRAHGTRVLHTIHGLAFDALQPAWKNALFIRAERRCARGTDALISVCDAMTRQALAAGVGTPSQFHTIYSGMDLAPYRAAAAERERIRRQLHWPADTVALLCIARLFAMKGAEDFLDALAAAHQAAPGRVKGVLIGGGPLQPALQARAQRMLPADAVTFTGLLPPQEIPHWVAAADVIVHPSLREGLARALVQAIAGGKPVVTYDIGGAREIVRHGLNGMVCAAGDRAALIGQTLALVLDTAVRATLSAAAAKTDVSAFDAAYMLERIEALYRAVLNRPRTLP